MKLFRKDYSVVSTCYYSNSESDSHIDARKKSLRASRVFNTNFNLVDSLFSNRSTNQNLRLPTGK